MKYFKIFQFKNSSIDNNIESLFRGKKLNDLNHHLTFLSFIVKLKLLTHFPRHVHFLPHLKGFLHIFLQQLWIYIFFYFIITSEISITYDLPLQFFQIGVALWVHFLRSFEWWFWMISLSKQLLLYLTRNLVVKVLYFLFVLFLCFVNLFILWF